MKITKLTAFVTVAMSFQATAFATQPTASVSGGVSIANTISGKFAVGQNGTAVSYAENKEAATAKVSAFTSYTPNHSAVSAGITGATTSDSSGQAYNTSTGSGSGSASSIGSVNTGVAGSVAIHGVTTGHNGGNASTQSNNQVDAGTNQGSFVVGQTKSGFDVQVQYAKEAATVGIPTGTTGGTYGTPAGTRGGTSTSSVSIADQKTGYASGASQTGSLSGMNAAGIANIGAAGQFFVKAGLSASTGTVSAP